VIADEVYTDPSALRALYVHDPRSRGMAAWRSRLKGPVSLSRFGQAELVNAVALGCFRRDYGADAMADALRKIDEDLADGELQLVDLRWRAALDRADELSRKHAATLGTRALDVLHVASALELQASILVTYDEHQAKLARACGLRITSP
jgi:predicted nucleic acid-binding protein